MRVESAAFLVSGLALAVSIVGTILQNRRASEALAQARRTMTTAVWAEALEAVQRLIGGGNLLDRDMGPIFQTLRVRMTALVDELNWEGLDRWLSTEAQRGLALARGASEDADARPPVTVDEYLAVVDGFMRWAAFWNANLRHARKVGPAPEEFRRLNEIAQGDLVNIYARRGWGQPPTDPFEGAKPLA